MGPLSEYFYLVDYWRPEFFYNFPIRIEDFLFGFFIGGIASNAYEVIFDRQFAKSRNRKINWLWLIVPTILVFAVILRFFINNVGVNSIYASVIGFLFIAFIIIILRRDLIFSALASSLVIGFSMLVMYLIIMLFFPAIFERWWMLQNLSDVYILNIPIEEILWGMGWGMVCGPMYEFFAGIKYKGGNQLEQIEEKFENIS